MHRASLALVVLLGSSLGANALPTDEAVPPTSTFVTGKSLDKAATRQSVDAIAMQAIDDAAAAAVIGALATQMEDQSVQFKLGEVDSERVSLRDMALDGQGLVRLDAAGKWMPIRFQALYDSDTQTVESPTITFVAQHAQARLDPALLSQFDVLVDGRLAAEFAQQPVNFSVDDVGVVGGDARYALIQGNGTADFAGEGQSDITVQGIFDRTAQAWIRIDYHLGSQRTAATVAAR